MTDKQCWSINDEPSLIVMRDFNINILSCDSDKYITDFIDTMYASLLYPTTNTPTRITATPKILIDNIFCNEFTKKKKKKWAGNILTSVSDHLTQYLLISNQTEVSLNNSKKGTLIYIKDTDLSFKLFLL